VVWWRVLLLPAQLPNSNNVKHCVSTAHLPQRPSSLFFGVVESRRRSRLIGPIARLVADYCCVVVVRCSGVLVAIRLTILRVHFVLVIVGGVLGSSLLLEGLCLRLLVVGVHEGVVGADRLALIQGWHLGDPPVWDELEEAVDEEYGSTHHNGDQVLTAVLLGGLEDGAAQEGEAGED